jgi:hypothetical protein
MPAINLLNLGLRIGGALLNKKRIAIYDAKNKKEILTGIASISGVANAAINYLIPIPAGFNLTEQATIDNVKIEQTSSIMEHPIETGSVFADYAVFNPVSVSMKIVLPRGFGYGIPNIYADNIVKELQNIYDNRIFCSIATEAQVFKRMVLIARPPDLDARWYGRLAFDLSFKQALNPRIKNNGLTEYNNKNIKDAINEKLGSIGL